MSLQTFFKEAGYQVHLLHGADLRTSFLRPPTECLARLSPDEFRIVPESEIVGGRKDPDALTSRAINRVDPTALAWDATLSSLSLQMQRLPA